MRSFNASLSSPSGLILLAFFLIAAVSFVVSSAIGILWQYHRIPMYDMWYSFVALPLDLKNVGWSYLVAPHNSHVITLTKLFFWLDHLWFAGDGRSLIPVNVALILSGLALLWVLSFRLIPNRAAALVSGLACTVMIWSFTQVENFRSGFQIQFFLAYLIPFASFFALSKASRGSLGWFSLSVVLAAFSILTMGNGIAVFPILLLLALFFRLSVWRVVVIVAMGIICVCLYFSFVGGSLSQIESGVPLFDRAALVGRYFIAFLGNPIGASYPGTASVTIGTVAGSFFLIVTISLLVIVSRRSDERQNHLVMTVLACLVYLAGSAFLIAVARADLGVLQSMSSRYATPTLWGWCFVAILWIRIRVLATGRGVPYEVFSVLAVVAMLLLPPQLDALRRMDETHHQRNVAVLALALGVDDLDRTPILTGYLFGTPEVLRIRHSQDAESIRTANAVLGRDFMGHVQEVIEARCGPFSQKGFGPVVDVLEVENVPLDLDDSLHLQVDSCEVAMGDDAWLRLKGWVADLETAETPRFFLFVNTNGDVAGVGVTGRRRLDVAEHFNNSDYSYSGYSGYVKKAYEDEVDDLDAIPLESLQPNR